MSFTPHPDFDLSSYKPQCPVTNIPKQKAGLGVQEHDVDDFILRGPEIFAQDGRGEWSLGYFDVRKAAIREAAEKHLGMVTAAAHAKARQEAAHFRAELDAARSQVESLRDQVNAMVLGNAELITQVAGLQDELTSAYSELYEDFDPGSEDVLDLSDDDLDSLDALAEAELS